MSRAKGNEAEELAKNYLYDHGFSIVEQNFYSRFGEIDIIALKDDILHFVEVKSGEDYESAVQNITPTKLSRLIKTGNTYIKKNCIETDYTFDAIIIVNGEVSYIENITI